MPVLFRPDHGWVGDVIPYFQDGEFWLFYLHDLREPGAGTAWRVVRTRDFVEFADGGVAIASGGPDAADLNAYTGSVVEADGRIHLFYTGQNPAHIDPTTGEPLQLVMHAISDDRMRTWHKVHEDTFGAPPGYEACDWRDPFVFRATPDGPWRMLVASRRADGPERRRGLIAACESDDLRRWRPVEPFWAPDLYMGHECPDLFEADGRWYLVYSEFSERFATRYRIAPTPAGPWSVPRRDGVDGRGLYAAKTVAGLGTRYAVGWIPTKSGERDDAPWDWAGDMAVHEVTPAPDGSLLFSLPAPIAAAFGEAEELAFEPSVGEWRVGPDDVSARVPDSYASGLVATTLPDEYLLSVDVHIDPGTAALGVVLRASGDGEDGYRIRLEPSHGRMVFDRWPRARTGPGQWQVSGDVPHAVELERPADLAPGTHHLDVLVSGTCVIAYLDDSVAMSARMYDRRDGGLALFVQEGGAGFANVVVATRK